jgi:hypothetical protein
MSLIFLCDENSTNKLFADYIYHQTLLPFRKLCLEDDDKLPVDLHVTHNDILAHHTLFGMQKKLSLLAFPHLKALMLWLAKFYQQR